MGGAGSGLAYDEDDLQPHRRARAVAQPDHRGAARGVDPRLEGVRARGDARPRRQRRDRLLDREPRPDGRAHRRLDHRRAGADPHRPRVPTPARHRDRRDPRGRRRHRRLQHPVRRQPRRRPDRRHRDEPAGLAVQRAGVARPPASRSPRSPPRSRSATPSTRSPTTSPPGPTASSTPASFEPTLDYVVVKVPRFAFEKFPGADPTLTTHMKSRRRGDGDRPQLHRGAAEGAALAREPERRLRLAPASGSSCDKADAASSEIRVPARRPAQAGDGRDPRRRDAGGDLRGHRDRPVVRRPAGPDQRGRRARSPPPPS